ncbi:chemotaxis protein CheW [Magnetospirillum aberrantis]|uniref:Chemotaxis protein CheW n=1 Tax=Magnetospirillum aberrantis SpK TaxID=908842 RepID=A0A7C9V156_9PROT|nr:chemotaxis protein CheW [Magnetospirillum aberrantis]NFV81734.1 chemotaxis protein CheW [Magnetospirillum aberrantis SpK]
MSYSNEAAQAGVRQFISFKIGDEEYGVDIMAIREIKGWTETTELPDSPPYLRGVINLRGAIIPVFDLRARFSGVLTQATARHVTIVVTVGRRVLGLLVDAVADIITVAADSIQPVPDMDGTDRARFLSGLVTVEGRMVALLDLENMLRGDLHAAHDAAA